MALKWLCLTLAGCQEPCLVLLLALCNACSQAELALLHGSMDAWPSF